MEGHTRVVLRFEYTKEKSYKAHLRKVGLDNGNFSDKHLNKR